MLTEVTPYSDGGGWSVVATEGYGCSVPDVGVEPKVGDTLRVYGGFGHTFHGQDLNGRNLWYLTPEQEEAEKAKRVARDAEDKRKRFEEERQRLDKEYAALPQTFCERIDKFRRTNPDWRWEFESYEMICCTDALKIASYCSVNRLTEGPEGEEPTAADNIKAFAGLPWEEQKKAGIDSGHSGNSFSFAVRLAYLWVTEPAAVVAEHGALTPLVGCEKYGCPHSYETDP